MMLKGSIDVEGLNDLHIVTGNYSKNGYPSTLYIENLKTKESILINELVNDSCKLNMFDRIKQLLQMYPIQINRLFALFGFYNHNIELLKDYKIVPLDIINMAYGDRNIWETAYDNWEDLAEFIIADRMKGMESSINKEKLVYLLRNGANVPLYNSDNTYYYLNKKYSECIYAIEFKRRKRNDCI